ncbi:MAG: nitroreductase family deazaflavin-dependent oxidoreductase [Ilumatobacter sp.]|nr:nitroreductase family deazaflavin-dependent oxidoreductase [Ilumatobacter sp.]MCB0983931.1 nitroreductase family deazaflavin-dependent oxidoreductase [Ilumatobacter sp.]
MSWLSPYTDVECCYLTTVGRRSGRLHEVEIWFGVVDDTLYMISGNGPTAHWFLNASANRHVTIRVAGETRAGEARVVDDPGERRRVGELMGAKYPWDGDPSIGLTFEAWCFDVPLLAVSGWSAAG